MFPTTDPVVENKDQKLVLKIGNIFKLLIAVPLKMYGIVTKMDVGWPNFEIGWKKANGWLLLLALLT